jgi:hypothetical protein
MTIAFPVTIPVGREADIMSVSISPIDVVGRSVSPFTRASQTYEHPGKLWQLVVELNPMNRAAAEEWISFLMSLRGRYGTFTMGDPSAATPRGLATGSPVVKTSSESGLVLNTAGWTSSADNILRKGDYIQVSDGTSPRLYKNLQDVNTTSGGVAALDLWPTLRTTPASGATITVNSCVTVWQLTDNGMQIKVDGPGIYFLSFVAEEALSL